MTELVRFLLKEDNMNNTSTLSVSTRDGFLYYDLKGEALENLGGDPDAYLPQTLADFDSPHAVAAAVTSALHDTPECFRKVEKMDIGMPDDPSLFNREGS